MATHKNQHHIPQYYFRYFSADNKTVNLLRLADGGIIQRAAIKRQAAASYYYGGPEVEQAITRIEDAHRPLLGKIRRSGSLGQLTEEEKVLLRKCVLFQRFRSLSERLRPANAINFMKSLYVEAELHNLPDGDEKQRLLGNFHPHLIREDPRYIQARMMETAVLCSPILLKDLKIVLLKDESHTGFSFADSPVVFHNQACCDWEIGAIAPTAPGLEIFFPISEAACLLFYDPVLYKLSDCADDCVRVSDMSDVKTINTLNCHNAVKVVYFGENTSRDVLTTIWREEKDKFHFDEYVMEEMEPEITDRDHLRRIFRCSRPRLRYRGQLSFLEAQGVVPSSDVNDPEHIPTRSRELLREFEAQRRRVDA